MHGNTKCTPLYPFLILPVSVHLMTRKCTRVKINTFTCSTPCATLLSGLRDLCGQPEQMRAGGGVLKAMSLRHVVVHGLSLGLHPWVIVKTMY